MKRCLGSGPIPSSILLIGEKPGQEEVRTGIPFSGRSGDEQSQYLSRYHLSTYGWRLTNIIKHYVGDRNPTPEEIAHSHPDLQREIHQCNPTLIIAVGAISTRYFLGEAASLEIVHGIPCLPGAFDTPADNSSGLGNVKRRSPSHSIILPIYHPALGFRDPDARSLIAWDYKQVAEYVRCVKNDKPIPVRQDEYAGREQYQEVTGRELAHIIDNDTKFIDGPITEFAIDTEGTIDDPFSLQVSWREGTGYFLRYEAGDYLIGLQALRSLITSGAVVIGHNLMHDIPVLRRMGLELRRARLFDTMYASYLSRIEAYSETPRGTRQRRGKQGLKPLAYRWNGTKMMDWEDVTSDYALSSQLACLETVAKGNWTPPKLIVKKENDGTVKATKPKSIMTAAKGILRDWHGQKKNKKGELIDIETRWRDQYEELREPVERDLGRFPTGSIREVYKHDKDRAIIYGITDSDQTLRLKHKFTVELSRLGLTDLMSRGMDTLPVFEEMQSNGMPASYSYFQSLSSEMWDKMMTIGRELSKCYYGGKPFNPGSWKQTQQLMQMRGLKGEKETSKGEVSTAQKSIQHLEETDPAIRLLFEWRRHEHIRDDFCLPIIRSIEREINILEEDDPERDNDIHSSRSRFLITRTATRRLAGKNPNPLNIPIRTKLGLRVREGFIAPDGYFMGAFDLGQIEYRWLAHYCKDPRLLHAFNSGLDVHTDTAAKIFGIDYDTAKEKRYRSVAKTVNYGFVYLQTGYGMADTMRKDGLVEWTEKRCNELISEVKKLYPGIPAFVESVRQQVYRDEYAKTYDGMIRYLPGIRSKDPGIAGEALRHAMSQIISGSAQDMLQRSMAWLRDRVWDLQDDGKDVRWLLQIHDELVLLFPQSMAGMVSRLIIHGLTKKSGIELRVPIEADGKVGRRWSDTK